MTSRPRGRPRAFDRAAALEQATRLFWTKGFDSTSVSDLTEVMGIGAPSLYAAFGDKKALFCEVLDSYGATHPFIARALAEEPTGTAAVARILREAADEYTDADSPPGCLMITAASAGTANADIAERLAAIRTANAAAITERLQSDIDTGVLPGTGDAATLARYVAVVLQGMSQAARDGARRADLAAVADLALRSWPAPTPAPEGGSGYPAL
ncbi:MAG: TetR/AcrR family transcriptional regulator [Mycobacteriaceae bacterium]|nr:TetR/AcrR family transcriptional regulator [Mycobacteriaceae bacterium]